MIHLARTGLASKKTLDCSALWSTSCGAVAEPQKRRSAQGSPRGEQTTLGVLTARTGEGHGWVLMPTLQGWPLSLEEGASHSHVWLRPPSRRPAEAPALLQPLIWTAPGQPGMSLPGPLCTLSSAFRCHLLAGAVPFLKYSPCWSLHVQANKPCWFFVCYSSIYFLPPQGENHQEEGLPCSGYVPRAWNGTHFFWMDRFSCFKRRNKLLVTSLSASPFPVSSPPSWSQRQLSIYAVHSAQKACLPPFHD